MSSIDNDSASVPPAQRKAPPAPRFAEATHNLALLDPPTFGWTAAGSIADLSEPHEARSHNGSCVSMRRDSSLLTFSDSIHFAESPQPIGPIHFSSRAETQT